MKLDTVKIKADTSVGYAIINKESFDSSKHELFVKMTKPIGIVVPEPKNTVEPEPEPVSGSEPEPKRKPGRPPASRKA